MYVLHKYFKHFAFNFVPINSNLNDRLFQSLAFFKHPVQYAHVGMTSYDDAIISKQHLVYKDQEFQLPAQVFGAKQKEMSTH